MSKADNNSNAAAHRAATAAAVRRALRMLEADCTLALGAASALAEIAERPLPAGADPRDRALAHLAGELREYMQSLDENLHALMTAPLLPADASA